MALIAIGFFGSLLKGLDWQEASRYLRASLAAAIILAFIAFNSLITSHKAKTKQPTTIPDAVRKLVATSEYAEAGIALTGDKAFLIADDESAFLAYADTGRSLITKGDPVGDPKTGKRLIWQLRELADQQGKRCAFYAVSSDYLPTFLDLGLSILKIGEVARVNLQGFTLGAFTENYIANFDMAVLRSNTGEIVAFANLFKGANFHELSLDLMRYRPGGPGFAMDALFAELMLYGTEQGYQ